jgi:hypothetical protein
MLSLMLILAPQLAAADEEKWWQQRKENPDGYYPHNAHMAVLTERGDSCLLCHPFSENSERDENRLRQLTTIANEPLEAICHSCHVEERSAPVECALCHPDPRTVWPEDHNGDYIHHHGVDGQELESCDSCHPNASYCTDCHFSRPLDSGRYHGVGFRYGHALSSRINPEQCGSCHGVGFCRDCHQKGGR